MATDPRRAYLDAGITTAGPERLLVMLVDRLHLDVRRAADAQERGDHDGARTQLLHAQEIVIELRCGLQMDAWSGAAGLAALYDWLLKQLVKAQVDRDLTVTQHCLHLTQELASAWQEAALTSRPVAVGA